MTTIIDLSTPEKMEAFGAAMATAAAGEKLVDLAAVAEASGTLQGPKVCYETAHYQIEDAGENWKARGYTARFCVHRRPQFRNSRVMECTPATSGVSAEHLIDALKAAEEFHMRQISYGVAS
jgi:hypothetical protein